MDFQDGNFSHFEFTKLPVFQSHRVREFAEMAKMLTT